MCGRSSGADADAGVGDADLHPTILPAQCQRHLTARRRVFDRVVDQVEQQLAQAVAIPQHQRLIFGAQPHGHFVLGHHLGLTVDVEQERVQLHRLAVQFQPGVGLGQQQQVVDQAAHARYVSSPMARRASARMAGSSAAPRRSRSRLPWMVVKGRAQVVADVGDQALLGLEERFQA